MNKKIAVFGSLTEDLFVAPSFTSVLTQSDEHQKKSFMMLPYGGKVSAEYIETHYGGGSANVAVALSHLGFITASFGSIGGDSVADRIIQNLKEKKVETKGLVQKSEMKSGFSLILTAFDGERTVVFTPEANSAFDQYIEKDLLSFAPEAIHLCHLSASVFAPIRTQLIHYISQNPSLFFSWNPGKTDIALGLDFHNTLFSFCDVLFLNAEEAESFSGIQRSPAYTSYGTLKRKSVQVSEIDDFSNIATVFLSRGVKTVVITDGRKGAMVYSESESFFVPVVDLPRVSTLGAGDAFASGFIAGMLARKDLHFAGKCASMLAASVVGKRGAQEGLLSFEELLINT